MPRNSPALLLLAASALAGSDVPPGLWQRSGDLADPGIWTAFEARHPGPWAVWTDLATGAPMTADMQFKIASQTKAFTGNLVLQLVGKCSPDPVSHDVVIRAMFGADASGERIRPTRDRAAA